MFGLSIVGLLGKWWVKPLAFLAFSAALAFAASAYRGKLVAIGYEAATHHFESQQNDFRRERQREVSRLIVENGKLQDDYITSNSAVAALAVKLDAIDDRLRKQDADTRARIKAASAQSLRDYAEKSLDNYAGCRADVKRFGLEAASCAAVAETLKGSNDLLHSQSTGE